MNACSTTGMAFSDAINSPDGVKPPLLAAPRTREFWTFGRRRGAPIKAVQKSSPDGAGMKFSLGVFRPLALIGAF
jgi:hypothetical protein